MSFYETPVRRLSIVRACGCFVLSVVLVVLPFVIAADSFGCVFLFALAGFCLILGVLNLRQAQRTSPLDIFTVIPDHAPKSEQVRHFRRVLWLSIVAYPILTMWTVHDLNRLESGPAENVWILGPIAAVYEWFGYWPAVMAVPALGLFCICVMIHRLRALRHNEAGEIE